MPSGLQTLQQHAMRAIHHHAVECRPIISANFRWKARFSASEANSLGVWLNLAAKADFTFIKELLGAGASVQNLARTTSRHSSPTPVAIAAACGNVKGLRLLLAAGADVGLRIHRVELRQAKTMVVNAIHATATPATENSKSRTSYVRATGKSEDKSCMRAVSREEDKVRLRKTVLPEMSTYRQSCSSSHIFELWIGKRDRNKVLQAKVCFIQLCSSP